MAISMKKRYLFILKTLSILVVFGCGGSEKRLLPFENFSFPIDIVYDSNNNNMYVISSNFDLSYKYGNVKGISINRLKPFLKNQCEDKCLNYNREIIIDEGISIGDYAGISLYDNGRIFVPLRRDDKIAVIDVDEKGRLSCGDGKKALGDCDEEHLIDTEYNEPFSLAHYEGSSCIYVSFLKSGKVLCIDKDDYRYSQRVFSDFTNGYEIGGIKDIDVSRDSLLVSAYAYMMSGRNLIPLSYDFNAIRYTVFLDFTDEIGNAFQESVKISKEANRIFMSLRNPDLLLTIDYAIYKDGTFIITDYRLFPLYRYPSRLYIEYAKSLDKELLFASLIDEDKVYVYDTVNLVLLTEIKEGLDGPFAMKMIDINAEDYLFLANFENSTISVYRFIPTESRFEYIMNIGKPRPKEKGEY